MQRGNQRRVEQGELLLEMFPLFRRRLPVVFQGLDFVLKRLTNAAAHFQRRGVGERHHQNVFQRATRFEQGDAPLHQRAGFAGTRARDDEHVAARGDGPLLGFRGLVHVFSSGRNTRYGWFQGSKRQTARYRQRSQAVSFFQRYGDTLASPAKMFRPCCRRNSSIFATSTRKSPVASASLPRAEKEPSLFLEYLNWPP